MIDTHLVPVGDKKYHITTFPAIKGLNYLNKIKTIVGPALAMAVSGDDSEEDEIDVVSFSAAAKALVDGIDNNNVEQMIIDIVSNYVSDLNGQPLQFDMEFAGRYDLLFGLVKEILVLNYGSLFLGSGDSGSPLKNLMNNLDPSSKLSPSTQA